MLLEVRRPRAALRAFEKALHALGDAIDQPGAWQPLRAAGWDARVQAARCAVLCAEGSAYSGRGARLTHEAVTLAAPALFPEARERLRLALVAAPGHPMLLELLSRAGGLPAESASASSSR